MQIVYRTKNGIGVLDTPQMVDHSFNDKIEFVFDVKDAVFELNNTQTFPIVKGKCVIDIRQLKKGTNLARVLSNDKVILPCQPFTIFSIKDKMKCEVATSLDTIRVINRLQDKVQELGKRICEIEAANIRGMRAKIEEIIKNFNALQERVGDLEAGFDPTVMAQ